MEKIVRDNSIDIMRFIGLAAIILAHVGPPEILYQLRNFDVPLMVLVSGMAFGISYKPGIRYSHYLWKRLFRLVVPVWVFLTGYFFVLLIFNPSHPDLDANTTVNSYLLNGGIGYVWIIRVFLLVALVSPFIYMWHKRQSSNFTYFGSLAVVFMIYEVVRYFTLPYIQHDVGNKISLVTHFIVPYGIIFAIGLRMTQLNEKQLTHFVILSLATFVSLALGLYVMEGVFVPTQDLKYPPALYYVSYALFVSCLLWMLREKIELLIDKLKLKPFVLFCAQNSIWIYLWHIPLVKNLHGNFALKYLIAFSVATMAAFIQIWLLNRLLENVQSAALRKNFRAVFSG